MQYSTKEGHGTYVRQTVLLLLRICIITCGIIVGIDQESYGFRIFALLRAEKAYFNAFIWM